MSVYWDNFGTDSKYSGIGVYARELSSALNSLGLDINYIDTSRGPTNKIAQFIKLNINRLEKGSVVHGLRILMLQF